MKQSLIQAYNLHAEERSAKSGIEPWKVEEREAFLRALRGDGKSSFLEIGAGPGRDSLFFADNGMQVTCTDLSPEMVRICKENGLDAREMDFYELDFPDHAFDAVYAMNCLLHVPKDQLDGVLTEIRRVLKPQGLLFMGVYGGKNSEGIWENDPYEPKRFFSFYTNNAMLQTVQRHYEVESFKTVRYQEEGLHFQSMILRKGET